MFLRHCWGEKCILSDWPGLLKVIVYILGRCLEFHLSDLTLFKGGGSGGKLFLFMLGEDGLEGRRDREFHNVAMCT